MSHLRLTRFRARTGWHHWDPRTRTLLDGAGKVLAGLVLVAIAFLLVRFPRSYARVMDARALEAWSHPKIPLYSAVSDRWGKYPAPPAFWTGDEPDVHRYLEAWPEVVAMQRRDASRRTWVRDQGRLVPLDAASHARLLAWFEVAVHLDPGDTLCPAEDQEADHAKSPRLIFAGEQWLVLKRWDIGSPAAERSLREALPKPSPIRLGFLPEGVRPRREDPPQPWGAWPNLQIDAHRIAESRWTEVRTNMFGDIWNVFIVPSPDEMAALAAAHRRHLLAGSLQSLAVAGLGALLWVWHRRGVRSRRLEAHRLAALTHSLKTPLAVLKMRCDLLRLDTSDLLQIRSGLMELSEEVDDLASTVDNGLRLFRASHFGGTDGFRQPLAPDWFEDAAKDMDAGFHRRGRALDMEVCAASAWVSPDTLRVALRTVLENSLEHGEGVTRLATSREGGRFCIRVQDQGPGPSEAELRRLGRPLLDSGMPGSRGLGLALLARIAEEEGWGLELSTREGEGFTVVLQIPAVPSSFQGTLPCPGS